MAKKHGPSELIRERLEELFRLGASLQQYIHGVRGEAPQNDEKAKDIIEELHRLEVRLSVVNEMLYQDKMDMRLDRAIDRARSWAYKVAPKNLTD